MIKRSSIANIRKPLRGSRAYPVLNIPIRAMQSLKLYFWSNLWFWVRWLFVSREDANYTYELLPLSRSYMAATLANNLDVPISSVLSYFSELEDDVELKKHVAQTIMQSALRFRADSEVRFGRRVAWYAIARILKPKVIVETGVDKGLGSVVLCAALLRNRDEGHPGEYFGTDIDRGAGGLFAAPYTQVGSILYGDSISSLRVLDRSIDLLINDSDHNAEYEEREYETIAPKLSARAVLIGDINPFISNSIFCLTA